MHDRIKKLPDNFLRIQDHFLALTNYGRAYAIVMLKGPIRIKRAIMALNALSSFNKKRWMNTISVIIFLQNRRNVIICKVEEEHIVYKQCIQV